MNNGEKATSKQIKKLYAVVRNCGKDPREYMKKLKEENGLNSLNELTRVRISELIDQFENHNQNLDLEERNIEGETEEIENEEKDEEVNQEEKKETEMEQIAEEMQVAVRYATRIAIEEVQGKIEAQGLASFIQKLATTMFLANRRQRVKEEELS